MFGITNLVKAVAGLVVAGLLVWAGYSISAKRIASLEGQLTKITEAGKAADDSLKKTKAELESKIKIQDEEHTKRLAEQQAEFNRRAQKLADVRKSNPARIAAADAAVKARDAEIAMLRKRMETASAEDKKKIQALLDAAGKDKATAVATGDSIRCLAMKVPESTLSALK
jgi:type II secretory pathway component GspD/PulD (secretin)